MTQQEKMVRIRECLDDFYKRLEKEKDIVKSDIIPDRTNIWIQGYKVSEKYKLEIKLSRIND